MFYLVCPMQRYWLQAVPLGMKRPYPTDCEPYSIDKRCLRLDGPLYPTDCLPPRAAKKPLQASNVAAGDAPTAKPSFFCDVCKLLLNSEFQRDEVCILPHVTYFVKWSCKQKSSKPTVSLLRKRQFILSVATTVIGTVACFK